MSAKKKNDDVSHCSVVAAGLVMGARKGRSECVKAENGKQ